MCYTKSRMSLFPGLIGHEKAKEVISRMLEHKTLPHALLFIGPVQVGKTMFIELLIKSLFETTKSLELIPDVLMLEREVDPKTEKTKSNLSVEQVREFVQRLSMSAMLGSWKVGFIKEADRLSMAAANALLKTLEEPKGKTFIVLRATSTRDVPATIVSRCQVIRLYSVSEITIQEALVKRGLAKSDATAFTKRSYGRPGIAIDAVTSSEQQAEIDIQTEAFLKLLRSPLPEQFAAVTNLVSKDEQNKTDELIQLLDRWEPLLRDVMLVQQGCPKLCMHDEQHDRIRQLATKLTPHQLRAFFQRIKDVRDATRFHVNAHLSLEHIFLSTSL